MAEPPKNDDWSELQREFNSRLETLKNKIQERYTKANEQHRETLGTIEGLRGLITKRSYDFGYDAGDEDEISKTTDINELRKKARRQREKAQRGARFRKWGKAAAPLLIGLGAGLWEIFKRIVMK